jgi:predicted Zn-dependent peptidase
MRAPKIQTFPSGLRVLVIPMPDAATVTVQVFAHVGSEFETLKQAGLSHFLEHMCFKGTVKRPSAFAITSEIEGIGADTNAYTTTEYTSYYVKGEARHFRQMLDVVADIYLNSTFPAVEMEKEKGVVIEEIRMYSDLPEEVVHKQFMELMYGDQPAGRPISGTIESVQALTQKDLISFHSDFYHAKNSVIVVSGAVDAVDAKSEVKKAFKSLAARASKKKAVTKLPKQKTLIAKTVRDTAQTHMVLGFPTVPFLHADVSALRVLGIILGGGMSSRLTQTLREEMGVCYYVSARQGSASDHGLFSITAGVTSTRVQEVLDVLKVQVEKLSTETLSVDELSRAIEYLTGRIALSVESTSDWAGLFGTQAVLGLPIQTPQTEAKEIRAVSATDIQRVAKKYLAWERMRLSLVGPKSAISRI